MKRLLEQKNIISQPKSHSIIKGIIMAGAGDLDTGFGTGGKVTTDIFYSNQTDYDFAVVMCIK